MTVSVSQSYVLSYGIPVDVTNDSLDTWTFIVNVIVGLATVGTLIWAIRSTLNESRLSRLDREKRDADRFEELKERERQVAKDRTAQAEHVAVWCDEQPIYAPADLGPREIEDLERQVHVVNTSPAPIYRVWVEFWFEPSGERPIMSAMDIPALAPGLVGESMSGPRRSEIDGTMRACVTFTDSGGRVWRRDDRGRLTLVKENSHEGEADIAPKRSMISRPYDMIPKVPGL